jgi:hypothetical protein
VLRRANWIAVVAGAALCGLLPSSLSGAPAPAVYHRRVINNHQVDMLPLFVWLDHKQGVRPLTSWKHIQGILERETVYGWLVRGTIEGQSGLQYLLLKNPPKKELARYRELESQLPKLEETRATVLPVSNLPAYGGWDWDVYGGTTRVPNEDFDRVEQAKIELQQVDGQIHSARQEMAGMLSKHGYFKVDAFALQMNQVYEGSPVFDFGFPPY